MAKLFLFTTLFLAATLQCSLAAVCPNPASYAGQSLCYPVNPPQYCGECVSFYKVCSGDGRVTSSWVQGKQVKGASIPVGTGIATFTNGKYDSGHTAIYMGQSSTGIDVWDQWVGQPVHQRTIRFGSGTGYTNDGDNFYVIL